MIDKKSPMVAKLRRDELVTMLKINVTDVAIAEIAAYTGVDCIWVDMEHVPADYRQIQACMLAAKARGAETVVRTTRGCYSNLTRPLEMDATAIMVPHIMDAADAQSVAHYTKFHPIGRRPVDGGNADGMYCMMDYAEYLRYSNEEKLTIIQIEDVEAMEQLDEIAATPGIDMLFFGPADFSQSLGIPTDLGNEQVLAAKRRVAEVARKHGKFAGTVGSPDNLKELYDMGYRLVNLGADVVGVTSYFTDAMKRAEEVKKSL